MGAIKNGLTEVVSVATGDEGDNCVGRLIGLILVPGLVIIAALYDMTKKPEYRGFFREDTQ